MIKARLLKSVPTISKSFYNISASDFALMLKFFTMPSSIDCTTWN